MFRVKSFPRVFVSATTGEGLPQLKSLSAEIIKSTVREVAMYFSHSEEHRTYELPETHILKQEKASQGPILFAYLTASLITKWWHYLVNPPISLDQETTKKAPQN